MIITKLNMMLIMLYNNDKAGTSHNQLQHLPHRPSVDDEERFRGAVEPAGCQGVGFARNDEALVIVRMG